MSKRKRSPDIAEKESIISTDSDDRSWSYDDVIKQIKANQKALKNTEGAIRALKYVKDDLLTQDAIKYMGKANQMCDQLLETVLLSQKEWIQFAYMPIIPMKLILSYLEFKDKSNLRLVSKCLMNIIDQQEKSFQTWKINTRSIIGDQSLHVFLQSNKDIMIIVGENFDKDEKDLLDQVFDRVVGVTANLKTVEQIIPKKMDRLESLSICGPKKSYNNVPPTIFEFVQNLRILKLQDASIQDIEKGSSVLPTLKVLALTRVKGINALMSLLQSSASSLEVLEWREISGQPGTMNFSFPKLNSITLQECSPEFISLLKCSTPSLKSIILDNTSVADLSYQGFDVSSVVSLELVYEDSEQDGDSEDRIGFLTILTKTAANLEKLHMEGLSSTQFNSAVPQFPRLKSLKLNECNANMETDIVYNSPSLKELQLDDMALNCDQKKYDRPLELDHLTIRFFDDSQGLQRANYIGRSLLEVLARQFGGDSDYHVLEDHLDIFSSGLKHLTLMYCTIKDWEWHTEFNFTNLTKLSLKNCNIRSGFHNVLWACRRSLEELEIYQNSEILLTDERFMPVLKKILVERPKVDAHPKDISRLKNLNRLLYYCESVEKLAFGLPDDISLAKSQLDQLEPSRVPNLKDVQIYPKPSKKVVELVKSHFSGNKNVTFWFYAWPDASKYLKNPRDFW